MICKFNLYRINITTKFELYCEKKNDRFIGIFIINIICILGYILVPIISDNYGGIKVLNISWLINSISFLIVPFIDNYYLFIFFYGISAAFLLGGSSV